MSHEIDAPVLLNFGLNPADMYRYGSGGKMPQPEDMTVTIPTKGKLIGIDQVRDITYGEYFLVPPERFTLCPSGSERSFPAVKFSLELDWRREYEALLVWIEEREEWVVLTYAEWQEDALRSGEDYSGPFALDVYCKAKLAQAYGRRVDTQIEFFNTPDMMYDKDKPGFARRAIRWNDEKNVYELISSRNIPDVSGMRAENTEDTIAFDDPEVLFLAIRDLQRDGTVTIKARGKITHFVQQSNHPYDVDAGWWRDDDGPTTYESGIIICELRLTEDGTLAPFTPVVQLQS